MQLKTAAAPMGGSRRQRTSHPDGDASFDVRHCDNDARVGSRAFLLTKSAF
jgi:hypothetical protein